jgi:hypothetical protein
VIPINKSKLLEMKLGGGHVAVPKAAVYGSREEAKRVKGIVLLKCGLPGYTAREWASIAATTSPSPPPPTEFWTENQSRTYNACKRQIREDEGWLPTIPGTITPASRKGYPKVKPWAWILAASALALILVKR